MPEKYPFGFSEFNNELQNYSGENPDEELTEEEFNEIKTNPPKPASFPVFVFIVALIKDFTDVLTAGFSGILFGIFSWTVFATYLNGKVGYIQKQYYKRLILNILDFIPGVNIAPLNTIFILRGYATEKKRINQILGALEALTSKLVKI